MKRFAVILSIAVLALGCVFAATSDTVVLETSVEKVIPCFEIYGKSVSDSTKGDTTGNVVVSATIDEEKDEVSLQVFVNEVGLKGTERKNFIRYKNEAGVEVKIVADSLKNKKYIDGTDKSMTETGAVESVTTPATFTAVTLNSKDIIHSVTATTNTDTVTLTAVYTGEKVSVTDAKTGLAVTDWTWTWDTSKLVAGETYRADITITYTVK